MKKIPRILTNTRVSVVNGLLQQIIDEYTKGDYSADTYLGPLFVELTELNKRLGVAIMRDVAESELAELDDITDEEMTLTHGLAKGYTCHPNKAIADAASLLFKMIEKYGLEVKSKSYREEYPLLGSMIAESKTETYAACIARLDGCAERFNRLEAAVDNFNAKQNAYLLVRDDEKNRESASTIKKQLISFINDDIAIYLNAMQKVNANTYGELAQFMANRISENNAAVRSRQSKTKTETQAKE